MLLDDDIHYVMFDDPKAEQEGGAEAAAADAAAGDGAAEGDAEAEVTEGKEEASKRLKTEDGTASAAPSGGGDTAEEAGNLSTLSKPTTRKERKQNKRQARKVAKGEQKPRKVRVKIATLPRATERINVLMPQLVEGIKKAGAVLKQKLFQVNFLDTTVGDTLVTLFYHKKLDEEWSQAAEVLRVELGVSTVLGRAKKQVIPVPRNFVTEELTVGGKTIQQKQIEGSFTQPNAKICESMLGWALDVTSGASSKERDLLELYCGNGNFSLAMAPNFRKALGTEISKVSVDAAQWNIEANGATNITIAAMSSEEFTLCMKGEAEEKVVKKLGGTDPKDFDFSTVLVDPPRAGMDDESCKMIIDYDNIVYISCNPETLRSNLDILCETHTIERFAVFDQFPYTAHLECGAYLRKK